MLNWEESNEYKMIQPVLEPGDKIDMPAIATGAFKLKRNGKTYKLKRVHNDDEKRAFELHLHLRNNFGWDLPQLRYIEKDGNWYVLIDWIEGDTLLEIRERVKKLPVPYYIQLGEMAAKMNNIKIGARHVGLLAWWPRNFIVRHSDHKLMLLDTSKLYLTDFPELFTIKGIVAETPTVNREQADAFLAGYRHHREYDIEKILHKYIDMFPVDHDLYIRKKLFVEGKKKFTDMWYSWDMPTDMSGMYVLVLGYPPGMTALKCADIGARRVYACDSTYVNIGPAHCRYSDIGKLISVYNGHTEDNLLYKHICMDTDHFIEQHIPETLKYIPRKKYDYVIFHDKPGLISPERKGKFLDMLGLVAEHVRIEGGE